MSTPSFSSCCLRSFAWDGTPSGRESTLVSNPAYITGTNPSAAVLYIHDALGWKFTNARLLADHFAKEANVAVYMPDFFGGEVLDAKKILAGKWTDPALDLVGFAKRNAREVREKEIFEAARELRGKYKKVGTVGYCFGGWGVLRLGAKEHEPPLVDCVVCAHPSWAKNEDFDNYGSVPIQIISPEVDRQFPDEMKVHAFKKLVSDNGVPVAWVHFPAVEHGCMTKGDESVTGEREAMVRGKDAAVGWFKQWLSG
ncbi:dienelactone hydrolase family protein [Setomelanomma holmii]|uniref:Dienelactone hydrolase family protein n=1 Tax=Setomelanomma holmii TaxID=210430 RepID=A0A9P4GYX5_9PLEO|nr:dienelactone hydrolase family protein [Setomelanomma holmii]